MKTENIDMETKRRRPLGPCFTWIDIQFMFLLFKLFGAVTWSWLWVMAPLWMFALLIVCFIIVRKISKEKQ